MSQSFLNRLKSYLDERLRNEVKVGRFEPFEIDASKESYVRHRWRWEIRTPSAARVRFVTEYADGTVVIQSDRLDKAGDYIGECLVKSYRFKFAKAGGNKEEEEKVWSALRRKEEKAREDYLNRRNLEKHLKETYWRAFLRLLWFDEVANRMSKEYGVEIRVIIDEVDYDSGFESRFDASNMDEEKKFEEIKKRVEAVIAAYKLAQQAYHSSEEGRREFLEFSNAVFAKYGIRRKRGL